MPTQLFPTWAYNSAGQPAVIVQTQAQLSALPGPGTWATTPYPLPPSPPTPPFDPGFQDTDTRLQQILIENRIQTMILAQANLVLDDPQTVLRPDVLANDSSLTS